MRSRGWGRGFEPAFGMRDPAYHAERSAGKELFLGILASPSLTVESSGAGVGAALGQGADFFCHWLRALGYVKAFHGRSWQCERAGRVGAKARRASHRYDAGVQGLGAVLVGWGPRWMIGEVCAAAVGRPTVRRRGADEDWQLGLVG